MSKNTPTTDKETTASYAELGSKNVALAVDAYATASRRTLEYWKSVWDIASRPYAATAVDAAARENFDRFNQIVSLTVGEIQQNAQLAAEFGEKLSAQNAVWQETVTAGMRGAVQTGISNMNFVKETATHQLDEFAKRVEDVRAKQVSSN